MEFAKNCNYLKKNKAVFIKKMKFVISIFCAINRISIDVAYYFKISRLLDFVLAAFSTVKNVMLRELNFGNISSACAKEY